MVCERCTFSGNFALSSATGGGAILVKGGALVRLTDSLFEDNGAILRAGGIEVTRATLIVERSQFNRNRVDLPGHATNAAGGAIYVVDGVARVFRSRFVQNAAGFSGGAILAIGVWQQPLGQPATALRRRVAGTMSRPRRIHRGPKSTSHAAPPSSRDSTARYARPRLTSPTKPHHHRSCRNFRSPTRSGQYPHDRSPVALRSACIPPFPCPLRFDQSARSRSCNSAEQAGPPPNLPPPSSSARD